MEAVSACLRQESLVHLLIAAAGSGRRMGADRNKLLLPLAGKPVIAWTLEAALAAERIRWVGIVGQEIDREEILSLVQGAAKPVVWIATPNEMDAPIARSTLPSILLCA